MTFPRRTLSLVAIALFGITWVGFAADARGDQPMYTIDANVNDPQIITSRGANLVWLPSAARRVGKLLVFLPSGGLNNLPTEFTWVGTEGARLGYHTIVLAYRNEVGINAQPPLGCGPGVDPPAAPSNCALNIHAELLDGAGESPLVDVDPANSIENRLTKVLQYLSTSPEHAGEGWSQFLDASGAAPAPKWPETVIAGQSLGGGEAFYIAQERSVYRVAAFSGWTDAKHGWIKPGLTATSRYFTQIHARDNFFARTCYAYLAIGLVAGCPLAEPFPLVDDRQPPFGSRQLVFNLDPAPNPPMAVADPFHSSSGRDGWIAKAADGIAPSPKLLNSWRSTLGDSDADTYLDQADNCPLVANADQTDSDRNGTGDACGPTFAQGTVGGSVPATLALTMGAPATFGAFTPGVDHTYDAATTANVISTAGDAALAVSDPSSIATGRVINGALALSEPLQASATGTFASLGTPPLTLLTYAAPVSNGSVAIAFRQHIGATQTLRTGAYGKTLTFTLSTTTP
jgi:thrombospondin type 3 repeat protein